MLVVSEVYFRLEVMIYELVRKFLLKYLKLVRQLLTHLLQSFGFI